MSAIVRLQGLPPAADSYDIRQFFYGLNIPRGGVYITGGKYGEAFIIFSTYEDANYAMSLTGRPLRNSCIYLSYSTDVEMRRALEVYRINPNDVLGTPPDQPKPSYIYVHGMPQKATKVDIREFFRGFKVVDVVFLKFHTGIRNGNALVKFAGGLEANEALKLDGVFLCGCPVTLKLSDEDEWKASGGEMTTPVRERSPLRRVRPGRRRSRTRSRSPLRRERRRSPYIREFYVHLINVSYRASKQDIKKFFFDSDMDDSNITFLLDKDGKRTREAFVMFTTQKDYKRALNLNLDSFKGHTINILPISKKAMFMLIDRMKTRVTKDRSSSSRRSPIRYTREYKKCVYLRNFSSDVTKEDIVKFFGDLSVSEDSVTLLLDKDGAALGEALVTFPDEKEAKKAEKLNHEKYQDMEILLSLVSDSQMKALLKGSSEKEEALVSQADELTEATGESSKLESVKATEEVLNSDQVPEEEVSDAKEVAEEVSDAKEVAEEVSDAKEAAEEVSDAKEEVSDAKEAAEEVSDAKEAAEEVSDAKKLDDAPLLEPEPMEASSESTDPLQQNIADGEALVESEEKSDLEIDESNDADMPEGMTKVFVRNLPLTVTEAEILDFFQDYDVNSVNLKDIGTGVATVLLADGEAESALEALNEREIGLKKVLLSLD